MNIVDIDINELKPYENNPRYNDHAVEFVMNSLKRFGFQQPIVIDKDNVVVAGHTRLKAAQKLGYTTVPVKYADELTPEEIKAYRLADNKTAEMAVWDKEAEALKLSELDDLGFDMSDFGFWDDEDEEKEQKEKITKETAKVPFTEVLREEHNYVVLYFDNEVDWLQMQSLIDISGKMNLSTRKDGQINEKMKRISVGRVFKGKEVLERLREHFENSH